MCASATHLSTQAASDLKAELQALDQNADMPEGFIQFAELALIDMPKVWEGATAEERLRVRQIVFGDDLGCSPDLRVEPL
jgi:hypothetical protein